MAADARNRQRRFGHVLGLLAISAWVGVAGTVSQVYQVRAQQTIPLDHPIRFCPSASYSGAIADINNESWNELTFLNAATGRKEAVLKGDLSGILAGTLTRNRHMAWTIHEDGKVNIWDMTEKGKPTTLHLPSQPRAVDVSPDGKIVAARSKTNQVELWEVAAQKKVAAFAGIELGSSARFFPDGQTLAVLTVEGVQLWDLATHQPRFLLRGQFSQFAIAPDGRSLATCDNLARVSLWDTNTGQKRASYSAPGMVGFMEFSPDSRKVFIKYDDPPDSWLMRLHGLSGTTMQRALEFFSIVPDRMEAAVVDAATGREYGRLPCRLGYVEVFADEDRLAIFPLRGAQAITLWNVPPRTVVHPLIAWSVLSISILLTVTWWHAGRAERRKADASSPHGS